MRVGACKHAGSIGRRTKMGDGMIPSSQVGILSETLKSMSRSALLVLILQDI